jgi:hypothetical protein
MSLRGIFTVLTNYSHTTRHRTSLWSRCPTQAVAERGYLPHRFCPMGQRMTKADECGDWAGANRMRALGCCPQPPRRPVESEKDSHGQSQPPKAGLRAMGCGSLVAPQLCGCHRPCRGCQPARRGSTMHAQVLGRAAAEVPSAADGSVAAAAAAASEAVWPLGGHGAGAARRQDRPRGRRPRPATGSGPSAEPRPSKQPTQLLSPAVVGSRLLPLTYGCLAPAPPPPLRRRAAHPAAGNARSSPARARARAAACPATSGPAAPENPGPGSCPGHGCACGALHRSAGHA